MAVLEAVRVTRVYGGARGAVATRALDAFDLKVEAGEFLGIMGPSGSGKTTLLQVLGSIDTPTSGEVFVQGEPLSKVKGNDLALFRRRRLGFIFQEFNLLDALTLRENMIIPLVLERTPAGAIEQRVTELAARLGIADVLDKYPYEVSGGQKQRAAAARALIHRPALVLADEPTGALDSRSARVLMESLQALNEQDQATILMVTHDAISASYCRRVLFIRDGRPYTELRRGDSRAEFYQQILDVLAALGGPSGGL